MNCYLHPDIAATAYCRACGRPLCSACQQPAQGTVFCHDHVPVTSAPGAQAPPPTNPYLQPSAAFSTPVSTSPGAAFGLGWIPGVGAIYNGQYLKGLVHAVIFGLLMSLASSTEGTSGQPLLIMMTMGFYFYMPFEAYHTAKKRRMGVPVDEWSSLLAPNRFASRTPIGPIILILIGVLFLLDTLRIIEFRDLARFWPVLLIVVGAFMLYNRITTPAPPPISPQNEHSTARPTSDFVESRHE